MTTRTSPNGRVTDYSPDATHMNALLWDFDINGAELKPDHVAWLAMAVKRVNGHPNFLWNIAVTGEASLTAVYVEPNNAVNWRIARERARVVSEFLRSSSRGLGLVFNPPWNAGTMFAEWAHHRIGIENDEDRGVYVMITTDSTPKPPPRAPTSVPVSQNWGIRYSSGGSLALGIGVGSHLFDIADLDNHLHAYYEFSDAVLNISPEDWIVPVSVTGAGDWTAFRTTGPLNVADFEGPARYTSYGAGPWSHNSLTLTLPAGVSTTVPDLDIDTGTTIGMPGYTRTLPGTGRMQLKSRRPYAYSGIYPP
ncbi:MAG TPA: hypothetical protein VFA43_00040 [Gemmatimonadaceae bacterium]|nr:hypothetical protein [Gemmatimonadaceae bacterium]